MEEKKMEEWIENANRISDEILGLDIVNSTDDYGIGDMLTPEYIASHTPDEFVREIFGEDIDTMEYETGIYHESVKEQAGEYWADSERNGD